MDKESTQLYCIYDPEGVIVNGTNSRETKYRSFKLLYDIKRYTHEDYSDFLERVEEEGYTCKPIQIANLEEEVVISKDDYRALLYHIDAQASIIGDLEAENKQLKIDFDVARSMIIPAGEL